MMSLNLFLNLDYITQKNIIKHLESAKSVECVTNLLRYDHIITSNLCFLVSVYKFMSDPNLDFFCIFEVFHGVPLGNVVTICK